MNASIETALAELIDKIAPGLDSGDILVDARIASERLLAAPGEAISNHRKIFSAAKSVEQWWISEGKNSFDGAPYCIFALRQALDIQSREPFEWPPLPEFPEVIETLHGDPVFTEHQMQGYANAYGETVRATLSDASGQSTEVAGEPAAMSADQLYDAIEQVLLHYRHSRLMTEDMGSGYPLTDLLTADGESIQGGIDEIRYICDSIYNEVLTKHTTPPPAKLSTETVDKGVDRLTVTPAMVKAAMPWLSHLHHMRKTDKESNVEEAIRAALAASDSATASDKEQQ